MLLDLADQMDSQETFTKVIQLLLKEGVLLDLADNHIQLIQPFLIRLDAAQSKIQFTHKNENYLLS